VVVQPQLELLGQPASARGPDSQHIADFVEANTPEGGTLFVIGYDPQLYWLADRRAPTRFFDPFEIRAIDERLFERRDDLRENPPDAIAAFPVQEVPSEIRELIDELGYEVAYRGKGARVWLRPGSGGGG
jgi:hypothetical protein